MPTQLLQAPRRYPGHYLMGAAGAGFGPKEMGVRSGQTTEQLTEPEASVLERSGLPSKRPTAAVRAWGPARVGAAGAFWGATEK